MNIERERVGNKKLSERIRRLEEKMEITKREKEKSSTAKGNKNFTNRNMENCPNEVVKKKFITNTEEDSPSVLIVGAGASGIAAASKLFTNGFKNIKILEAESRIGGRIHAVKFGDYLAEMGAQYVIGEEGNVIYELASPLGVLESKKKKCVEKILQSSGNLLDQLDADDLIQFYYKTEEGLYEYAMNNKNSTLGKYFENEIDKYVKTHLKWQKNKKGMINIYGMTTSQMWGTNTWDDISTVIFREYQQCPGNCSIAWKKLGYSTILDIMMKRFPNPKEELPIMSNTILKTEVSLIDYSDPNGNVRVKTTNGETYSADHVIVTCSLGVLKDKHKTLFKPALQKEKQNAIENICFGSISKIFFLFDEPWWSIDMLTEYTLIWEDEDLEMLEKDDERSWLRGLTGFYPLEGKPNLLFTVVGGGPSREMEKLTDEQVKNHCDEVFRRFFGKIYNVTNSTDMIRTLWYSNKNFKGICSSGSSKFDPEIFNAKKLSEPVGKEKPVVLFAGEATSPTYFGTAHGAIESGYREADRIIQLYSREKKN